jgi:hypothetical protein
VIEWYPCFLDVEASGFGPESWPVSVAWCDSTGEIRKLLIDPSGVPEWTHWDPAAEQIHGLDRERLCRNGVPPQEVAARLEDDLKGALAFSDAPDFDAAWIARLYEPVGRPVPFRLDHADDLLVGAMLRPSEMLWQGQARLERVKTHLHETCGGRHDAGYDVGFLVALWRSALGETVKMNHGIGPVPETTATGSFVRVKKDSHSG